MRITVHAGLMPNVRTHAVVPLIALTGTFKQTASQNAAQREASFIIASYSYAARFHWRACGTAPCIIRPACSYFGVLSPVNNVPTYLYCRLIVLLTNFITLIYHGKSNGERNQN
jgi:hypothetical protein